MAFFLSKGLQLGQRAYFSPLSFANSMQVVFSTFPRLACSPSLLSEQTLTSYEVTQSRSHEPPYLAQSFDTALNAFCCLALNFLGYELYFCCHSSLSEILFFAQRAFVVERYFFTGFGVFTQLKSSNRSFIVIY